MHLIINECFLFDIFSVSVLVFNLQEKITVKKDGKGLRLRKVILKDNTDKISALLFALTIYKVSDGTCYNLTRMRVKKYHDERVLKSTEKKEVCENTTFP